MCTYVNTVISYFVRSEKLFMIIISFEWYKGGHTTHLGNDVFTVCILYTLAFLENCLFISRQTLRSGECSGKPGIVFKGK